MVEPELSLNSLHPRLFVLPPTECTNQNGLSLLLGKERYTFGSELTPGFILFPCSFIPLSHFPFFHLKLYQTFVFNKLEFKSRSSNFGALYFIQFYSLRSWRTAGQYFYLKKFVKQDIQSPVICLLLCHYCWFCFQWFSQFCHFPLYSRLYRRQKCALWNPEKS